VTETAPLPKSDQDQIALEKQNGRHTQALYEAAIMFPNVKVNDR
jgi:hypothetical protein